MLYLITTEQRKKIIDEYQARIWLIAILGLISLAAVFFVLSLPTLLAMRSESAALNEKIEPLEAENRLMQAESTKEGAVAVTKDLALLQLPERKNVREIYTDIIQVFEGVSGVVVQSVSVDTVTKTINVICTVRDKDVAKALVDHIQTTGYAGADLPYTVLSERASFIFSQKLTYTE
jgi:hypothetical protein